MYLYIYLKKHWLFLCKPRIEKLSAGKFTVLEPDSPIFHSSAHMVLGFGVPTGIKIHLALWKRAVSAISYKCKIDRNIHYILPI